MMKTRVGSVPGRGTFPCCLTKGALAGNEVQGSELSGRPILS